MSKLALDNVCEGILGYKLDSLHNPECELTRALDDLANLPTGRSSNGSLVYFIIFFQLLFKVVVLHLGDYLCVFLVSSPWSGPSGSVIQPFGTAQFRVDLVCLDYYSAILRMLNSINRPVFHLYALLINTEEDCPRDQG